MTLLQLLLHGIGMPQEWLPELPFFFVAGLIFGVVFGMGQFTHAHAENHHIAEEPHIQVSCVIYNDEQVK